MKPPAAQDPERDTRGASDDGRGTPAAATPAPERERWDRLKQLFESALERDPASRGAYLDAACGEDRELREEAESLLAAHDQAGSFFDDAPVSPTEPGSGSPPETDGALAPGTRLGPYEILAFLKAGGMGEVYRARDTRLGREVAVKLLLPRLFPDSERVRRFEQEARSASALNHPNILTVHDFGTHDSAQYIVTELIRGLTLRERLAQGPLPAAELLSVAVQLAAGLAKAHEAGIVHRDLKPDNVMLTEDGLVKILDFGLATLRQADVGELDSETRTRTRSGVVLGTVGYMSPEQARTGPMDFRSDQFLFGAVLYEMATGRKAFGRATPVDSLFAILHEQPEPMARLNPGLPEGLQAIMERCLAKDPSRRYASTRELLHALQALEAGRVEGRMLGMARLARRPRLALAGAALALALAAAVAVVAVRAVVGKKQDAAAPRALRSMAVLPLDNLTGDPGQDFFADGMTEALIGDLGKLRGLRVISRTTAMSYKGSRKPLPEIARELGVEAILEGSVQRSADRVQVSARLIEASADRLVWSERYERSLRDVLSLQSEIAAAVSREVRLALTPEEQARLARVRPVDPWAHELYLKGRHFWNQRTPEALQTALTHLQEAVRRDPGYAAAWAAIADTYNILGTSPQGGLETREAMAQAREAALEALELDEESGEPHAALGWVRYKLDWDWPAAEKEFRRAIELRPGYATARQWYSNFLQAMGRLEEARVQAERALELDPLSPVIVWNRSLVEYHTRDFDAAIVWARRALEIDPSFVEAHRTLGLANSAKGLFREAVPAFERAGAASRPLVRAHIAVAHARAGERAEARRMLEELRDTARTRHVPPAAFALVHAALGEKDKAFSWLEKAYDERSDFLVWLGSSPDFDDLRTDPRFTPLVRRVGLPSR